MDESLDESVVGLSLCGVLSSLTARQYVSQDGCKKQPLGIRMNESTADTASKRKDQMAFKKRRDPKEVKNSQKGNTREEKEKEI